MAATSQPTEKPPTRWGMTLFKLAVSALVLAVIFRFVPIESIWDGIRRTNIWIWLSVLGLFLLGHCFAALKWRMLVDDTIAIPTVIRAHFAGLAANLAMPGVAGGDVARAALLSRHARSTPKLVVGSLLDRLIDVGGLFLIAAAGATLLGTTGRTGQWLQAFSLGLVLAGVIVFFSIPTLTRLIAAKMAVGPETKLKKLVSELANYIGSHRVRLLICVLLSVAIQTGFVGLNVMLSGSMGGPVGYAMWMFAWPLAKLIATLPISIGGLGVREASLASVFAAFGAASPVVISVGFIWQTILISAGLVGLAAQLGGRSTQKAKLVNEDVG